MENDNTDPESPMPSRRLTFSAEDFDDYLVIAKLRFNSTADLVLSDKFIYTLASFQRDNIEQFQALDVPFISRFGRSLC